MAANHSGSRLSRSLMLAISLVALAPLAACGGADREPAAAPNKASASEEPSTAATEKPTEKHPEPTCAYRGTGGLMEDMQVEVRFTNPLGEVHGVEVTYALLDGPGGTRFFTGTAGGLDLVDIMFPSANERFRLSVNTGEDLPPNIDEATIGCTVLAVEESTDIGGYKRAADTDTCKVVDARSSSGAKVEVAVTSPYSETTKVQTWWALQAPGSVTFATDTEVVDLVAAGETFTIVPRFGSDIPKWVDGDVTCAVLGFWDQGN